MSSQSSGPGRRRINTQQQQQHFSAEEHALNIISKEAEARLAAKTAARAEAREIRLKEKEKQQRESEGKQDRIPELTNEHAAVKVRQQLSGSRSGSRRGSTESNDSDTKDTDFKTDLRELEEKYKAAMMTSAQLDNEKQSLVYQVELLKDQLEEKDEEYTVLQRDYKEKCRLYEFQKRDLASLEHELSIFKQQLEIKDKLIEESGFVILANDKGDPVLQKSSQISSSNGPLPAGAVLVSTETRDFLKKSEGVTLGTAAADVNTNKSGVRSHDDNQASSLVSSHKVDEVDGSVENVLLSEVCDSDNINRVGENSASNNSNSTSDVVLHGSIDVTASESLSCEHELSRTGHLTGSNGDGTSVETEFGVSSSDSSLTADEKQHQTHVETSFTSQEKNNSGFSIDDLDLPTESPYAITSTSLETGSDKDSVDNDPDEVDEFFDAISTLSPLKIGSFDEHVVSSQTILTEGSSVDPEIVTEENMIRLETSHTYSSTGTEGGLILIDDVTVTDSSTDTTPEDDSNKQNILETESSKDSEEEKEGNVNIEDATEAESSTDNTQENEECVNKDAVEEVARNGDEGRVQAERLETSQNELTEVETRFSEKPLSVESSVEVKESSKKNKEDVENNNTDEKLENQTSSQDSENVPTSCLGDLRQDSTEVIQHKEMVEAEHMGDVTESATCESQDSSIVSNIDVQNSRISTTEEALPIDAAGTEEEVKATVELSACNLSTDHPNEIVEQQQVKETDVTQSTICHIQDSCSSSNPELSDVPLATEILCEDVEDRQNDVKEGDDIKSEVSQDSLNTERDKGDEIELNTHACEDDTEHDTDISNNALQEVVDDDEENKQENDGDSPVKDACKKVVRTASFGGSEASDGAGLDDYDLDDIDDILNTAVSSSDTANEVNTNPSTQAELTVTEAKEPVHQEVRNYAKSPSDKDVNKKEEIKSKGSVIKKAKEKVKNIKKEGKEKIKSSEKESKDKADKGKSKDKEGKEKAEKSKSSKKESAQERKAEKGKHSKKEAVQDSKVEASGGEEDKHSLNESQTSLEPDDLEGALDKQMLESERGKAHKKSSKKLSIFKKVFK